MRFLFFITSKEGSNFCNSWDEIPDFLLNILLVTELAELVNGFGVGFVENVVPA